MEYPIFPVLLPALAPIAPKPTTSAVTLKRAATKAADRQASYAADGTTVPVIYGTEPAAGGLIAGALSVGSRLWLRVIWCVGECDSITNVTANGEAVPASVIRYDRLGTASQTVVSQLAAAYTTKGISYTDTLPNVCYSVFSIPSTAFDTFPEFTATIKGRKVATSSGGTPTWSDNPAYCLADFRESALFGMGLSVNWTDVATIAAACDETIGGEKRRTLNLTLAQELTVDDWLATLCAYAGCWPHDDGGTLRLARAYPVGSPVYAFDKTNIVAGSLRLQKAGRLDIPTVLKVRYTDATTTPPSDGLATAYAAGVLAGATPWRESVDSIALPGVNRYSQAYREAVERLNALTLSDLSGTVGVFDVGLKLQVGDPITVTHPVGLTAKAFWITAVADEGFGRYTLAITEYDPAIPSSVVVSNPTTPDSGLSIAGTPPTLTGLAAAEEIYRTGDGLISSRLRVTWTDPEWPNTLNVLVRISDGSTLVHEGSAWGTLYVSPALQEGKTYTVTATVISRAGVAGIAATTAVAMVGKIGVLPGNVPAFDATEAGGKVYARWSAATDLDTLDYELRYGAVGVAWDSATYIQRIAALAYTIEGIPPGEWDFLIKARDSYKQYSATEAEKTVTVTLDSTAAQLGSATFSSPTLVQMDAYVVGGVTYWTTDNDDAWGYGYTGANWDSDSLGSNVWPVPTSSTGSSWTSNAWDLGGTVAATIASNLAPVNHSGSAVIEVGYSTNGSDYTWTPGASAKVVARYVKVRATMASGGAMTIVGPVTASASGYLRKESGQVTSSASAGALVQLAGAYAQAKAIQLTANAAAAMQPVYDRVIVHPQAGLSFQTEHTSTTNPYTYWQISDASRVIVSGDYLEWDVWVDASSIDVTSTGMIGGVEIDFSDATSGRSISIVDGAGVLLINYSAASHGSAGQWVSRKCSLTPAVGKTAVEWSVVCESDVIGTHRAIYRNIRVTDGAGTTRLAIWTSGEPTVNAVNYASSSTNRVVGPANSFLAYCFDGSNAQVAKPLSYTFEGA